MQCVKPLFISGVWIPCGRCIGCRIAKQREWALRIQHEAVCHESSIFVTFTYNDDHLPGDMSIYKKEMVLFMKRLRKYFEPRKIRYFLCGEYGDEMAMNYELQVGRPHYHAILFNVSRDDFIFDHMVKGKKGWVPVYKHDCWENGNIFIGDVTYESARYTAKYCLKKVNGELRFEKYLMRGLEPPFALMSKGIGREYVDKNKKMLRVHLCVYHKGKEIKLPDYYKKRIGLDESTLKNLRDVNYFLYGKEYGNSEKDRKRIKRECEQKEKNIKAREEQKESRK